MAVIHRGRRCCGVVQRRSIRPGIHLARLFQRLLFSKFNTNTTRSIRRSRPAQRSVRPQAKSESDCARPHRAHARMRFEAVP